MPKRVPYLKPSALKPRINPAIQSMQKHRPERPKLIEAKRERDSFYSSATWMRLRATFLYENPVCEICLEAERLTPATIVHHKQERLARPDRALDRDNLQAVCGPCHTRHHKTIKRDRGSD